MADKIVLYGTSTCQWCRKTREFFKEHRIKFVDVDVGKNARKAEEMIKKSGQRGVPVIDINGKIIMGYDEGQIRKLLKIK